MRVEVDRGLWDDRARSVLAAEEGTGKNAKRLTKICRIHSRKLRIMQEEFFENRQNLFGFPMGVEFGFNLSSAGLSHAVAEAAVAQ